MRPDEVELALRALDVPEDVAQRHLARLEAARVGRETVIPLRSRRRALRATVGGGVLAVTLLSGAGVAAASTAQPGDVLYGVKTARERVQLTMARDGDSRARLELKLARTRLGEAAHLFRHGQTDRAIETLARADAALASAGAHGDDAIDSEVWSELDHRIEVLSGLLNGGLPDTAADAAREALDRAVQRHSERPVPPGQTKKDDAKPDKDKPGKGRGDHGKPTAPPGNPSPGNSGKP